jgi:hypothetical protein
MNPKCNTRIMVPFFAWAVLLLVSLACGNSVPPPYEITSPDGLLTARRTVTDNGTTVYEVIENETGESVFTTYSQYPDSKNDVKAAKFSDDSSKFAVAYHYGHNGNYTWIGVWSIETGELSYSKTKDSWSTYLGDAFDN